MTDMMKIAGHTMGAPEYTLFEAIEMFKEIGLDGIEIIIQQDGYQCAIPLDASMDYVKQVRAKCDEVGLKVSGVTPYMNLYNSLDEAEREEACAQLRRVVDMAVILGAGFVRIYGGKLVDGEIPTARSWRSWSNPCASAAITASPSASSSASRTTSAP